jgi:hypothetical protein
MKYFCNNVDIKNSCPIPPPSVAFGAEPNGDMSNLPYSFTPVAMLGIK